MCRDLLHLLDALADHRSVEQMGRQDVEFLILKAARGRLLVNTDFGK